MTVIRREEVLCWRPTWRSSRAAKVASMAGAVLAFRARRPWDIMRIGSHRVAVVQTLRCVIDFAANLFCFAFVRLHVWKRGFRESASGRSTSLRTVITLRSWVKGRPSPASRVIQITFLAVLGARAKAQEIRRARSLLPSLHHDECHEGECEERSTTDNASDDPTYQSSVCRRGT